MCPQSAWIRGCKVTLVAFVWLFSTVRFQMCPQSACIRGCKVTLVAFLWLLSTVFFSTVPSTDLLEIHYRTGSTVWVFYSIHLLILVQILLYLIRVNPIRCGGYRWSCLRRGSEKHHPSKFEKHNMSNFRLPQSKIQKIFCQKSY